MYVCMYITALRPGEILFRIKATFLEATSINASEGKKIPVNWSDTFLRIFQAIPGTVR